MTLKEKFKEQKIYFNPYFFKLTTESAETFEKIADDYAIELLEWLSNEKSKFAILYGNQKERFSTFEEDYTSKQLLEIFKEQKGL